MAILHSATLLYSTSTTADNIAVFQSSTGSFLHYEVRDAPLHVPVVAWQMSLYNLSGDRRPQHSLVSSENTQTLVRLKLFAIQHVSIDCLTYTKPPKNVSIVLLRNTRPVDTNSTMTASFWTNIMWVDIKLSLAEFRVQVY